MNDELQEHFAAPVIFLAFLPFLVSKIALLIRYQ